jgi:hypothetical protein
VGWRARSLHAQQRVCDGAALRCLAEMRQLLPNVVGGKGALLCRKQAYCVDRASVPVGESHDACSVLELQVIVDRAYVL